MPRGSCDLVTARELLPPGSFPLHLRAKRMYLGAVNLVISRSLGNFSCHKQAQPEPQFHGHVSTYSHPKTLGSRRGGQASARGCSGHLHRAAPATRSPGAPESSRGGPQPPVLLVESPQVLLRLTVVALRSQEEGALARSARAERRRRELQTPDPETRLPSPAGNPRRRLFIEGATLSPSWRRRRQLNILPRYGWGPGAGAGNPASARGTRAG